MSRFIEIDRNVSYVQAKNCLLCIHIGGTAVFFGTGVGGYGARLELFNDGHRFRWRGRKSAERRPAHKKER